MSSKRRTTLGPISVNNGRSSMGVPGGSKVVRGRRERMSMAPRVGSEPNESQTQHQHLPKTPSRKTPRKTPSKRNSRKSLGGHLHGSSSHTGTMNVPITSMRTDPRPINDKSFISTSIKSLMHYLLSTGYTQTLNPKILSRPSGKDFNNIITFLLRRVDPTFNDGTLKFEDEVAHAFKALGYPFNISKTALVAVGSPHTWPGLLAALTWLIELLSCDEADLQHDVNGPSNEQDLTDTTAEDLEQFLTKITKDSEKAFFAFLISAYEAFLLGNDEQHDALEDELVEHHDLANQTITAELERITDLNANIVETIEGLSTKQNMLPDLEKKREDYCTDLEKFQDLIHKLNEHRDSSKQKVQHRTTELKKIEQQVHNVASNVQCLNDTIANQELSVDDARKMQNERARTEEAMEKAVQTKQDAKQTLWQIEIEVNKHVSLLETVISSYNDKAKHTELPPTDAADDVTPPQVIELNSHFLDCTDQAKMLNGVDIQAVVLPHLLQMKNNILNDMAEARQDLLKLLDQEEATEVALIRASDMVKVLEIKANECSNTLENEKKQQETALATQLKEVQSNNNKVSSLRDPASLEQALQGFRTKVNNLKILQNKQRQDYESKKRNVQDEISMAIAVAADHKEHVQRRVAELHEFLREKELEMDRNIVLKNNYGANVSSIAGV